MNDGQYMLTDYYKLGKDGKTPEPVKDLDESPSSWGQNKIVKQDHIEEIFISTVFLGLDHSYNSFGPPILFETMIFGGEHDLYQERYASWGDAVEGHQNAINLVKSINIKDLYMNKRIILVGAAASGKDYLKKKFGGQGFKLDVSYTTRPIREGEVNGVDYNFLPEKDFQLMMKYDAFYEWAQHGEYKYGTGKGEWADCDVFIMETQGVSEITHEDRKKCFVMYLNPPRMVRQERLRDTRGWTDENIAHRSKMDGEKFDNFTDYDIQITDPNF